ncbi:hypothetical protein MKX03_004418 [Papaver bracteatum]|nr:hypothetical protein MKX03_004418 [Papaver bracteatum]
MASASAASSSSSKQQVVLWGPNYVKVYKPTTTADNNTEASTAGLQSDEQMEVDRPDFVLKEEERPPYVIVVHGPPKVGKSTLIRSLVEYYSKGNRDSVHEKGPITIISGKKRRIQFVECPNSVSGMLDAAKYADAVILLIDTYTSFEMETFEFVNILRVHGMPMVMGVLTSLDLCTNVDRLSRTKEYLKKHFTTEIYEGARIFCLSGLKDGMCKEHEILHLVNFLSSMEFYPLSRRDAQPYVLVHIAGVGDFPLFSVTSLADPYPLLAGPKRKRSQKDKEHDASEGFKPGTYLRLEVEKVPFEMVQNYNPDHLILVGVISPGEETLGYVKATLTRHSWHKKLLRSSNPIIVSIGWRRYQTIPVYAVEDRSGRLQMLHYTPVGTQCLAKFWGRHASPNTGVVIVQSLPDKKAVFRILASAVVVDFKEPVNDTAKIFWKLKCVQSEVEGVWSEFEAPRICNPLASASKPIEEENVEVTENEKEEEEEMKASESEHEDEGEASESEHEEEVEASESEHEEEQEASESEQEEEEEASESEHECLGSEGEEASETEEEASESEDEDSHLGRRHKLKGLRTVRFIEREPDFNDRISAKSLLCFDNKDEQKEFAKHPLLVISKEEQMLEIHEIRDRMKNCLQDFLKQRQHVRSKEEEMLVIHERGEKKDKFRQEMMRRGLKVEFDSVGV